MADAPGARIRWRAQQVGKAMLALALIAAAKTFAHLGRAAGEAAFRKIFGGDALEDLEEVFSQVIWQQPKQEESLQTWNYFQASRRPLRLACLIGTTIPSQG